MAQRGLEIFSSETVLLTVQHTRAREAELIAWHSRPITPAWGLGTAGSEPELSPCHSDPRAQALVCVWWGVGLSPSSPSAWGSQGLCLHHRVGNPSQPGFSSSCPLSPKVPALGKEEIWVVADQGRGAQAIALGTARDAWSGGQEWVEDPYLLDPCEVRGSFPQGRHCLRPSLRGTGVGA